MDVDFLFLLYADNSLWNDTQWAFKLYLTTQNTNQ